MGYEYLKVVVGGSLQQGPVLNGAEKLIWAHTDWEQGHF